MPSSTLTIEEVYGGGGNTGAPYKNDYIVIHNETNSPFDLTGYSVQYASATGASWQVTNLAGSIAAGGYYLVQEAAGTGAAASLPTPDATGAINMSGTAGKVALVSSTTALTGASPSGGTVVDLVGFGATNGSEGAPVQGASNTQSVARINFGNTDTDSNAADFVAQAPTPYNSASTPHAANGGGATSLSIAGVTHAEGDGGTTSFDFTVTRSGVTTGATTVHYATADGTATAADNDYVTASGALTFAANETTKTISILVNGDTRPEPTETFSVTLSSPSGGATLGTATATGTITNDDVSILKIGAVQGAAHTSPYVNQTVTVAGAVTQVVSNGFYVQDAGDGDDATSDGVLVFTSTAPTVLVGQAVQVTGVVSEYAPATNTDALTVTQIAPSTNGVLVTDAATTHAVAPVIIGAGGRLPPTEVIESDNNLATFHPATDGIDFYESLEGMVVTVKSAQALDATYSGQTWVVADNGAEATGLNARGGLTIAANDFNPERIQIYKSGSPAYAMGDHLGDVTGVVTYYAAGGTQPTPGGNYELLPSSPLPMAGVGGDLGRPVTTLQGDSNHLAVGAYNVENLDPTDPQARFDLLASDIVTSLKAPDIVSLEEIQDADGPGAGMNYSGAATAQKLIDAIVAHGGPHYQYIEVPPTANNQNGGEPNGNIRTGFIYNPDRVTYEANSVQLINDATPGAGTRPGGDAFYNSRHPLLANFDFNGQQVTVVGVHNYSRGGSQELFGANQPATNNGDDVRLDQSTELANFLASYKQTHPNMVVAGDFNAYYFEDSLKVLSTTSGLNLTNLVQTQAPNERYSTEYEGNAQQIDNLLVSSSLSTGAQFQTIHVNTGQVAANQASDHDPIVSLLTVGQPAGGSPPGGGGTGGGGGGTPPAPGVTQSGGAASGQLQGGDLGDSLTAGSAGDTLMGGGGADTLTTGAGRDQIFGQTGDDHIVVGAASQGARVYAGQGNDVVDETASNAPNYVSGDLGDDTVRAGAGFETVLGGQGDDVIVGGSTAGPGSMQLLFGNQGNDRLSYAGAGGVELFGGQDGDTISITATQAGQIRYAFGNLGADTLTATGGADSLYGGQGDDVVSVSDDTVGHNYLSGDLGNDAVTASRAGADTVHGGQGADTITLTAHAAANGDRVVIGAGESTAAAAGDEGNLQHVIGFASGSDHIVLSGHAALSVGAGGNLATFVGGANASEAAAFASAYVYAYGDGGANAAHVGATGYLAVQESYGGTTATYLFTADHHAVALVGVAASALQSGDVLAG